MSDLDLGPIEKRAQERIDIVAEHGGLIPIVEQDRVQLLAEVRWLRARVAALEAGIRNHSCGISRGCTCPGGDHHDEQNTMCRYGQPFDKELELRALLDAGQTCPHGDPTCPCPDGDLCHHEDGPGSPGWPKPVVGDDKADSEEGEQRERMGINHVKG